MKNLFFKLLLLFIVYYLIQFAYSFFSKGYEKEYIIVNDYTFNVNELYTANKKNETNNYLINISVDEKEFLLQTYHNFGKKQEIVTNIHYYKDDNYSCIYPEFTGDIQLFDVICTNGEYYMNYSSITNKSQKLVEFVNDLTKYKSFSNDTNNPQKYQFSTIYVDNIVKGHYIALSNYKGVDLINDEKIKTIAVFENDIYKRPLSYFVGKKYITADYTKTLYFDTFKVVDLVTGEIEVIKYENGINFNSYFMGYVNDSLYLIDKTSKIQYEVDLSALKVTVVGNVDTGARLYNSGKWENVDINNLVKEEKKFTDMEIIDNVQTYKKGNKLSGYRYHFINNNGKCDVYKTNIQDNTKRMYLFTMNSCNNQVFYLSDYIYYVDDTKLNYYSDHTGVKTLLSNNELKYNNNIIVGGYIKSAK